MFRNFMIAAIGIAVVAFGAATSAEAGSKAGSKVRASKAHHAAMSDRACPLDIFSRMHSARAERPAKAVKAARIAKPERVKKQRVARQVISSKGKAPKLKA